MDMTPKTQSTKTKVNKSDYTKLKSSTTNETINKVKATHKMGENIYKNLTDKEACTQII